MILITGVNGFFGKTLSDYTAHKTIGYDHDILDYKSLEATIDKYNPEHIYHFASPSSQIIYSRNKRKAYQDTIEGTKNVLRASHEIPITIPTTSSVYGVLNSYALGKLVVEDIAKDYPNATCRRVFAGYGGNESHKGEYASVIYQWLKAVKNSEPIEIWGDGTQSRDFVYQDDVIQNLLTDSTEDIGTGASTTFNEVLEIIKEVTQVDPIVIYKDKPTNYLESTQSKVANCKTTLREGIFKTWQTLN